MKTVFIKARSEVDIRPVIAKLNIKGRIGLLTTIQHLHKLKEANKLLKNSVIGGQILGCNVMAAEKIKDKVDCFLYIGSGRFHPLKVALKTGKKVYIANPFTNEVSEIIESDVEAMRKRIKGAYLKFLAAKKIGILVSTKPGQERLKEANALKRKLKKECFIFLFSTLSFNELDNFNDIECWVNTACPRIALDDYEKISKPVIDIEDLEGFLKK